MKRYLPHTCTALLLSFFSLGCSSDDDGSNDGAGNNAGSAATSSGGSGNSFGNGGSFSGGGSGGNAAGGPSECSADFATTELQPVFLAVAFDVSGSMGKGDYWYHDKSLKWDPVVAATTSFFKDARSAGVSASLTFFPADDDEDRCDADVYVDPDVPMTELPSQEFEAAIQDITPMSSDDWRGGTPTLAVVNGTLQRILPLAQNDPGSKYALVLITDGYPQGCDDDVDNVQVVKDAVAEVAATVPTYVIGVGNPTETPDGEDPAPETVQDLHEIAMSGGTESAYLISTGDPTETANQFRAAVDAIRSRSVACTAKIPPPPAGQTFDKERVNVTYTSQGTPSELVYDPECSAERAWKFDDEEAPTMIEMCPSTCALVQADPSSALNVEFGCQRREPPVE